MQEIQEFSKHSSYKINFTKSEMMEVNLPPKDVAILKKAFPLWWQPTAINYLGVEIPSDLERLAELNYGPLSHQIIKTRPFRGSAAVKLDILPKLFFRQS